MPEVGFDREEKRSSNNYLRLKDGERAVVRMLSLPVKFRDHWIKSDQRSTLCSKREHGCCEVCDGDRYTRDDKRQRVRFSVPFYVHAISTKLNAAGKPQFDEVAEVKVFEGSDAVRELLGDAVNEVDGDWKGSDFTIARKGEGLETKYSVLPRKTSKEVPDGLEVPDLFEQITNRIADASANGHGPSLDEAMNGDAPAPVPGTPQDDYGDPFAEDEA